jgi:hypothetical protein
MFANPGMSKIKNWSCPWNKISSANNSQQAKVGNEKEAETHERASKTFPLETESLGTSNQRLSPALTLSLLQQNNPN